MIADCRQFRPRQVGAGLASVPRLGLAWFIAVLVAASAVTASFTGSAAALTGPSPGGYVGKGFDACTAPPPDLMAAWLRASPYRAVGIYIGGVNRACAQPQLTASWVQTQQTAGWHLMPIYLGLQPYCTTSTKQFRFTAVNAAGSGRAAANDAVVKARALGLVTGSTIFNDIEAYRTTDPVCRAAVLTFQSQWTARLHDYGFLSGFYSSRGSGIADQVAVYASTAHVRPDYLWFARYDGVDTVSDAGIPSTFWSHRRAKQYRSPQSPNPPTPNETYGGKTLAVDRNQIDVAPVPATPFGDVNGNGWSDLLVRESSTGVLYLSPGNGTGFGSAIRFGGGWNGMSEIARLGDFDRDGYEDMVAAERATGALWLYRGTRAGFASRLRIGLRGWNVMREITPVGDVTGDGSPDLLAVRADTGHLYLYPGRGAGLRSASRIGGGWKALSELTGAGDFNRDGRVDLLARTSATGELWLYPGTRAGFGPRVRVATGWNSLRDLVGVGDFDRDGFNDLLAVEGATGRLFRYPGRGTSFGRRMLVGSGWTANLSPLL